MNGGRRRVWSCQENSDYSIQDTNIFALLLQVILDREGVLKWQKMLLGRPENQ